MTPTTTTIMAYHFVGEKLRDGRAVPPDGVWLEHTGPLKMCKQGLHASLSAFDALRYAQGYTLCLVECGGQIIHGDDKLVCSRRRIVARFDAEELLWEFARQQALGILHLWNAPDVVVRFLKTGDPALRAAAGYAAGDNWDVGTAGAAARTAVWAAAGDAWSAADAAGDAAKQAFEAAVQSRFSADL